MTCARDWRADCFCRGCVLPARGNHEEVSNLHKPHRQPHRRKPHTGPISHSGKTRHKENGRLSFIKPYTYPHHGGPGARSSCIGSRSEALPLQWLRQTLLSLLSALADVNRLSMEMAWFMFQARLGQR